MFCSIVCQGKPRSMTSRKKRLEETNDPGREGGIRGLIFDWNVGNTGTYLPKLASAHPPKTKIRSFSFTPSFKKKKQKTNNFLGWSFFSLNLLLPLPWKVFSLSFLLNDPLLSYSRPRSKKSIFWFFLLFLLSGAHCFLSLSLFLLLENVHCAVITEHSCTRKEKKVCIWQLCKLFLTAPNTQEISQNHQSNCEQKVISFGESHAGFEFQH